MTDEQTEEKDFCPFCGEGYGSDTNPSVVAAWHAYAAFAVARRRVAELEAELAKFKVKE